MSQRILSEKNDFSLRAIPELSKASASACPPQRLQGTSRLNGMFSAAPVGTDGARSISTNAPAAAAAAAAGRAFRFRPVSSTPQAAVAARPRASPLSVAGNVTRTDNQVAQLHTELRNLKNVVCNERRLSQATFEDMRTRLEAANASHQEAVQELASARHERSHLVSRDKFDQALAAVMKADALLAEKDTQLAAFAEKKADATSAAGKAIEEQQKKLETIRASLLQAEAKNEAGIARERDLQSQLEAANARAAALEGGVASLRAAAAELDAETTEPGQPAAVGSAADTAACPSAEANCLALEAAQKELHLATEAHTAALGAAHAAAQTAKEEAASLSGLLDAERACVAALRETLMHESEKAIGAVAAAEQLKALGDPLQIAEEHARLRDRVAALDASAVDGAPLDDAQTAERAALVAQGDELMQRYNRFATLSEPTGPGACVDAAGGSVADPAAAVPTVDSAGVHILSHSTNRVDACLSSPEAIGRVAHISLPPSASPVGAGVSFASEVARRLQVGSAAVESNRTEPSKDMNIGDAILQDLSNLLKATSPHYVPAEGPGADSQA